MGASALTPLSGFVSLQELDRIGRSPGTPPGLQGEGGPADLTQGSQGPNFLTFPFLFAFRRDCTQNPQLRSPGMKLGYGPLPYGCKI
jgi:hypothetical protein